MWSKSPSAEMYIGRSEKSKVWVVKLPNRVLKSLTEKGVIENAYLNFLDKNYGGKEGARKATIDHRNDAFARAGMELTRVAKTGNSQKSISGLVGVVPGFAKSVVTGQTYVGRWYALTGIEKTQYSVLQLGMKHALWAAIHHRQAYVGTKFPLSKLKFALRVARGLPGPQNSK